MEGDVILRADEDPNLVAGSLGLGSDSDLPSLETNMDDDDDDWNKKESKNARRKRKKQRVDENNSDSDGELEVHAGRGLQIAKIKRIVPPEGAMVGQSLGLDLGSRSRQLVSQGAV